MAKVLSVAQFVYKYPTEDDIKPSNYTPEKDICQLLGGTIKTIGVQAPQGTKIYINENSEAIVGPAGVFELDNVIEITSFRLQEDKGYLNKIIIDVIYDKESE